MNCNYIYIYISEMLVELQLLSFAAEALCRYSAEESDTYIVGCKYLSFFFTQFLICPTIPKTCGQVSKYKQFL